MAYVPDPTNVNQPIDSVFAETATAEFRALKAYIQGLVLGSNPVGSYGLKNKVLGGDFSSNPWQRGNIVFDGTALRFSADHWRSFRGAFAAGMSVSRQIGLDANFKNCMRISRDVGDASLQQIVVGNSLENRDCVSLIGKPVTFAIRGMKGANLSGVVSIGIFSGTGTNQNIVDTGFTGQVTLGTIDIQANFNSLSDSTVILSVVMPASATQLGILYSHVPAGVAGAADFVDLDIVQIEDSPVFTGFERRNNTLELLLLERYFWKTFTTATTPAQNVGINTGQLYWTNIIAGATNTVQFRTRLPVPMFTVPTVVLFNSSNANAQARDETNNLDCSATAVSRVSESDLYIQATANAGSTVGAIMSVHATASAEF